MRTVQELMRHDDLNTTQGYTNPGWDADGLRRRSASPGRIDQDRAMSEDAPRVNPKSYKSSGALPKLAPGALKAFQGLLWVGIIIAVVQR